MNKKKKSKIMKNILISWNLIMNRILRSYNRKLQRCNKILTIM